MSQLNIRSATVDDIPSMLEPAEAFLEYHPLSLTFDKEYMEDQLKELIARGVILIASENSKDIGWMGGIIAPIPFSLNDTSLVEMFWWVDPKHRESSAGINLLREFEEVAKQAGVTKVTMTATSKTPRLYKIYEKLDYVEVERSFCKEI